MSRRVHWWTLVTGIVVMLVTGWLLVGSWSILVHSHPAHLVTLSVVFVVGVLLVLAGFRPLDPDEGRSPWRWVARAVLVLGAAVALGMLLWLRPLGASDAALDALASDGAVEVDESWTRITLTPVADPQPTGLVFYPGAKVDARAYANTLRLVAEAGYPVTILKVPYQIAFVTPNAAGGVVGDSRDVTSWVVGGHSLGGTVAARFASRNDDEVDGLLLWASYPAGDMSDASLEVLSVSGSEDGLATTDDILDSAADLPADTEFVVVEGGNHAYFGDYGSQDGDGEATITRQEAQAEIVAATLGFLERVTAAAAG